MKRIYTVIIFLIVLSSFAYAEKYSLKSYLVRVEERSNDLILARKDVTLAELGVRQAKSALFPSVFAQAGYNRNFLDVKQPYPYAADSNNPFGSDDKLYPVLYQDVVVNTDNEYSVGVAVNQALFNLKAYHALKFGEEYTALTGTIYNEKSRTIRNIAKKMYFQAVLLEEVRNVKESSLQNDRDAYLDMRKKFEAGLIMELEVLRAEVAWKTKIAEVSQAKKDLEVALINLKALAGVPLEEPLVLGDDFASVPGLPVETDSGRVIAARSDYELLVRQERLREIGIDLAKADFYPTVSASLTYAYTAMSDKMDLSGGTDILQLGIKVALPVYMGGVRLAAVENERINLEKSRIELKKKQDEIVSEIRRIFLSLKEAKERIESARAVREIAERAYALAKLSQENGLITQLELNESAVQLEGARLQYTLAVFEYLVSYFDWEKATGG
jgi:outer membrane protein TolC